MAVLEIAGHTYEVGGSVIHPGNRYMVEFAKKFGKRVISPLFVFVFPCVRVIRFEKWCCEGGGWIYPFRKIAMLKKLNWKDCVEFIW